MEKCKSYNCGDYSSSFQDQPPNSYNFNGPSKEGSGNNTGFSSSNDPELKRKKRVASYDVFTTQGKLKTSVHNSFKWIKNKFQ